MTVSSEGGHNGVTELGSMSAASTVEAEVEAPPPNVPHLTVEERVARGKAARAEVSRADHASFEPATERDPIRLLEEQAASRVPELVPIRYGRMLVSPFTFYRGAAAIMAQDLVTTPRAGLTTQLCGDAHLSNFGGFATPERSLIFDLNDFDETLPGPFEWDVKRLAASFEIAGRNRGCSAKECRDGVLASVRSYREAMRGFAAMRNPDVWYARLDVASMMEQIQAAKLANAKTIKRATAKAHAKDSMRAFNKLTTVVDGEPRIISDPPLIIPIDELAKQHLGDEADIGAIEENLVELMRAYRRTLQVDRRSLIESFRYAHLALKVVGVGSVGTRAFIMLLLGRDHEDPLFLQVKEAGASVLEPYLGKSQFSNHGERVVAGQRMMQAASDIFLGWIRNPSAYDGGTRDFYVRQLWDWKTSVDLETITAPGLALYADACGWTLARAHARSGDRIAIASYLGKGDVFDRAIAEFAVAYADQNEIDYQALVTAVRSGRIAAKEGI
jgi:uncharacterized protein (DUF2252 family)